MLELEKCFELDAVVEENIKITDSTGAKNVNYKYVISKPLNCSTLTINNNQTDLALNCMITLKLMDCHPTLLTISTLDGYFRQYTLQNEKYRVTYLSNLVGSLLVMVGDEIFVDTVSNFEHGLYKIRYKNIDYVERKLCWEICNNTQTFFIKTELLNMRVIRLELNQSPPLVIFYTFTGPHAINLNTGEHLPNMLSPHIHWNAKTQQFSNSHEDKIYLTASRPMDICYSEIRDDILFIYDVGQAKTRAFSRVDFNNIKWLKVEWRQYITYIMWILTQVNIKRYCNSRVICSKILPFLF